MKLRRVTPDTLDPRQAVDSGTLRSAQRIVASVAQGGDTALRALASAHDALPADEPLVIDRPALDSALASVATAERELLERMAARIRAFAEAQRASLQPLAMAVPGGAAGHDVAPVDAAGCYAPGGRYALVSSVLMTAVTARAAGVERVVVASPRPGPLMLAAAAVAGADIVLPVGGAQAIAAMAYGTESIARVDVVVGPGNRWVTAAKQLVVGRVGIDMLAGPSELVVLADDSAPPDLVAADLIAQAEHDPDAIPILVTTDAELVARVERAFDEQLPKLPTADTARTALQTQGRAVICGDIDEAIDVCNRLAPEHLEVMTIDPQATARRLRHYGSLFIGSAAAEVLGDYGAGPNHVLPTGGTARHSGGLSVFDFLRVRSWLRIDDLGKAAALTEDAAACAELEGLAGHAAAARARQQGVH
jgi:histidinol dehydrogenase